MKETKDIYVYVDDYERTIAGPFSIVAVIFLEDLTNETEQWFKYWGNRTYIDCPFEFDQVWKLIQTVSDKIIYLHEFISPIKIELNGRHSAVQKALDKIVPALAFREKIKIGNIYIEQEILPRGIHFNYKFRFSIDHKRFITQALAAIKRKKIIKEHYARIFPDYQLDQNFGNYTPGHADIILDKGPIPYFHHTEQIDERFMLKWCKRIYNYDIQEINWFHRLPQLFKDKGLDPLNNLGEQTILKIANIVDVPYPEEFNSWVLDMMPNKYYSLINYGPQIKLERDYFYKTTWTSRDLLETNKEQE